MVSRHPSAVEDLDDEHATAAAGTWTRVNAWSVDCDRVGFRLLLWWRHAEQLARLGDVGGAVAVGEETVMPDAMEALRQHVHQKAPDKLVWVQGHCLLTLRTFDTIIFETKGHAAVVGSDEAPVAVYASVR